MIRILIIYLFGILNFFIISTANAANFIEGFEDVPLMDGLKQIPSQDFSFQNEETGYTEAMLDSSKRYKFSDIKKFYIGVLPKFGWAIITDESEKVTFLRESDVLEISQAQRSPLRVLISLKSKN